MWRFLEQLLCPHFQWSDKSSDMPYIGDASILKVGLKDYRTGENYWGCFRCGKVKDFGSHNGIPNIPINLY